MRNHAHDVIALLSGRAHGMRAVGGTTEVGPGWSAPPAGYGLYAGQLVKKTPVYAMGVGAPPLTQMKQKVTQAVRPQELKSGCDEAYKHAADQQCFDKGYSLGATCQAYQKNPTTGKWYFRYECKTGVGINGRDESDGQPAFYTGAVPVGSHEKQKAWCEAVGGQWTGTKCMTKAWCEAVGGQWTGTKCIPLGVSGAPAALGGIMGVTHMHAKVGMIEGRPENTIEFARRVGRRVQDIVASNPHKPSRIVQGVPVFTSMRAGEVLLVPVAGGSGMGALGNPCNPFDEDFDLDACMGGGGGGGGTPTGGEGGGMTTSIGPGGDGGFFDTDEAGSCAAIGGTWTGSECLPSGQFVPGDPTAPDYSNVPQWVKDGMAACADKGMDYDAVNNLCAPKGSKYGPKGEPAKGSVPVTGTGGTKTGGGGPVTKPPTPPTDPKSVTTTGKSTKTLLIALGVVAGVAAVGGGAYYLSKKKKNKGDKK